MGIGVKAVPEGKLHVEGASFPVILCERDGGSDTTGSSGALLLRKKQPQPWQMVSVVRSSFG